MEISKQSHYELYRSFRVVKISKQSPSFQVALKGDIDFVHSVCPSIHPSVLLSLSITKFLITYNSAVTDQKFSYLVWGFSSILHL